MPALTSRRPAVLPAVLALLLALSSQALAGAGEACRDEAAVAERAAAIPEGLLLAIGNHESGRYDARAGGVLPWPWAVNRDGEGHLFETRDEAVAYVAEALRAGARSIDVGCFQIDLHYHPSAFANLEQAFDATANAAYAARFLSELHARTGSWETAVGDYHSATSERAVPYRNAVFTIWRNTGVTPIQIARESLVSSRLEMGIRIWVPTAVGAPQKPMVPQVAAPAVASAMPERSVRTTPGTIPVRAVTLGQTFPVALAPRAITLGLVAMRRID